MVGSKPKTKFEPVQLKAEQGWYVRITLPHGEQIQMSGFETEARKRACLRARSAVFAPASCSRAIKPRPPMRPTFPQHAIGCATPTSSADRTLLHPRPTA
jgi:hypothetical protein